MAFNLADVLKDVSNSGTGREQIEYIPLNQIDEDPNNFYQLTDLDGLAENISLCGLQQPIRVRQKDDGRYIIVSGHRRRAALEMLVQDDPERWAEVSCIVERDAVSPTLQQLRLIYANANTRKMSSAEISQQAEEVEKLLYRLKEEEGYEFPGRMRDHVAEAVGQSKTKLARLKVIRENLDASWVDAWKKGKLNESQAYALAQMPPFWQSIIKEKWGCSIGILYADTIDKFRKWFEDVQDISCQHGLTVCEHTATMMQKNVCRDGCAPCTGCCFDCDRLQTCKNCCPEAAAKKKELREIAKAANQRAKEEQEVRDRPGAEFARMVWDRIGKARERSGTSVKDIVFARGESFYNEFCDDPKQKRMENGEGDYSPNSTVSFGYNLRASDVMHIVSVADALKCSVDYLLGRTDDRESHLSVLTENDYVSNSGTVMCTGNPPEEGTYLLMLQDGDCEPRYEKWKWDGDNWVDWSGPLDPYLDGEPKAWMPMPKLPGTEVSG